MFTAGRSKADAKLRVLITNFLDPETRLDPARLGYKLEIVMHDVVVTIIQIIRWITMKFYT